MESSYNQLFLDSKLSLRSGCDAAANEVAILERFYAVILLWHSTDCLSARDI